MMADADESAKLDLCVHKSYVQWFMSDQIVLTMNNDVVDEVGLELLLNCLRYIGHMKDL